MLSMLRHTAVLIEKCLLWVYPPHFVLVAAFQSRHRTRAKSSEQGSVKVSEAPAVGIQSGFCHSSLISLRSSWLHSVKENGKMRQDVLPPSKTSRVLHREVL